MEMSPVSQPLLQGDADLCQEPDEWRDGSTTDAVLLPHPPRSGSGQHKLGGSESSQRLLLLALWLLFICCGYVVARLGCFVGLPLDGVTDADAYDTFDDLSKMLQCGVVLAIFLHVMEPPRFRFLFVRSGWYFIPTFLATPPVYSLISLADISRWGRGMWALEVVAVSAALTSIGWHARTAWRIKSRADFAAYVGSRAAVVGFYAGAGLLLAAAGSHHSALHVHHLYLGWCIASWAEFDHPISVVTLALGLGIFVQGIGAFSFASNFEQPGCFTSGLGTNVTCAFHGEVPFRVSVCPGENGGVYSRHHCTAQ